MVERRLLLQLCPFLLAAVALHVAVLWLRPEPSGGLQAGAGSPVRPVQVTIRAAAPAGVRDKAASPSTALGIKSGDEVAQTQVAPAHAASPPSASGPPSSASGDDAFLPRSRLTIAPAPLVDIVIEHPLTEGGWRHYVGELSLFIDEAGRVVRIRSEGAPLPKALEDAARAAFANARFTPGEVEGRKVRSRIRIEVTFDERPRTAPLDTAKQR